MDSEDPLFLLYTSGSTGKPKGVQHSQAGYILWAQLTMEWVFDIKENDTYWCTADIGWITGHTYIVYGPLAAGATTVMFEGVPTYPDAGRAWKMVEDYRINQFYTAPTAIRLLHKLDPEAPKRYDLSSLRILGTVGEPIDPAAWKWYYEVVGRGRCSIVDTWWQTETGGHMISPLPAATPIKPGSATFPLPGIFAEIIDENGNKMPPHEKGLLCITKPWPSMIRTIWGDPERFIKSYFSTAKKDGKPVYFSGDGAIYDEDGYIWITGRVDDVINVSGHRLGTAEIEAAIKNHPHVAEVAVVGKPDEIKGESVFAYIVLKEDENIAEEIELIKEINDIIKEEIGAIAKVDNFAFVPGLPKTRSGKIMRRILRAIAKGEEITQDTSTLENPQVVEEIISIVQSCAL
jgi:acetyl-CoA synthetase